MYIGLIDSGIGGKAFLKGIYEPENSYILIMDKAFFPYGNKTEEFLIKRTLYLCNYLLQRGVDKIILACNTLSIMVLPHIKYLFNDKVMGVIELFDDRDFDDKTIFIGSKNSIKHIKKIYPQISALDCQELINKIENHDDYEYLFNKTVKEISSFNQVLLGCTHFIEIKNRFKDLNILSQDDLYKNMINGL